ncbi:MAG: acyl-homoserine-lactone synthase [Bauldia sp.]
MIVVVQAHNAAEHADLLTSMYRLRAHIFGERLKWAVEVKDGLERDKYDDLDPVYIVHTDAERREALGSLRLLPTTGPTLVSDVFADTVPDAARLTAPSIWECTRFCIDDRRLGGDGAEEVLRASGALLAGLGEVALASGIESIVGNFDAAMLRIYRRIGVDVEVLGQAKRFGRTVFFGLFPVSEPILLRVKARLGDCSGLGRQAPVLLPPSLAA